MVDDDDDDDDDDYKPSCRVNKMHPVVTIGYNLQPSY